MDEEAVERSLRFLRAAEQGVLPAAHSLRIVGDYLAFYRTEPAVVLVHRILQGARDYTDIV